MSTKHDRQAGMSAVLGMGYGFAPAVAAPADAYATMAFEVGLGKSLPPVEKQALGRLLRPRRLYHDIRDGKPWLSCVAHGPQIGPVSQDAAERGHAEGTRCPQCAAECAVRAQALGIV